MNKHAALSRIRRWDVRRFRENPIITPYMLGDANENINGPALIRTPSWLPGRLGAYYLYFAHHRGTHIRLAYADDLRGPWRIHAPGALSCGELPWNAGHIASPDVLVDDRAQELRLYFHTLNPTAPAAEPGAPPGQCTFVATSADGLVFTPRPEPLGPFYFRVWAWKDAYYALPRLAAPLLRSPDGLSPFEALPSPFEGHAAFNHIRHVAVHAEGDELAVFFSRIGDAPESIHMATVRMHEDWTRWSVSAPCFVLGPETGYEGANLPPAPSRRGMTQGFENALRDPFLYAENGRYYLFYCVVAERGIAVAELLPMVK